MVLGGGWCAAEQTAAAGGLRRLLRAGAAADGAGGGGRAAPPAPAVPGGAHGPWCVQAHQATRARVQWPGEAVLQAALLCELYQNRLERLDHQAERLLRQLLPRHMRGAPDPGHFSQLPLARDGAIPAAEPAGRSAVLLLPGQVLAHFVDLLRQGQ